MSEVNKNTIEESSVALPKMDSDDSVALPTTEQKSVEKTPDGWVCPEFKVSGAFASNMVLQREKPIKIWGFSTNVGGKVFCEFNSQSASTIIPEDGKWTLTLMPERYSREGRELVIYHELGHREVFTDVLVGDVYLIGGQSNAEVNLSHCMSYTPSLEFYEDEKIRLFPQRQGFVYTHQEFCNHPQRDIINPEWTWMKPTREAACAFSAMGFYFARELTRFVDVPIGLVMMAAGGACIRELLPEALAHNEGYFVGANVKEAGYYNALIHPFIGLSFRAMLFFQGESEGLDRGLAEKYTYELALLVADERRSFGFEFPFYNVQLSSYCKTGSDIFRFNDIIRMKQFDALQVIPNSSLVVDMDLGSPEDFHDWAHSPRKLELGERLAKVVLAKEYGIEKESEVTSPMPVEANYYPAAHKIMIEFKNVSSGLTVLGYTPVDSLDREIEGFSVGDRDDQIKVRATVANRSTVLIDLPEGVVPDYVNYAYFTLVTIDNANLRGGNNLPAPAFSIPVK